MKKLFISGLSLVMLAMIFIPLYAQPYLFPSKLDSSERANMGTKLDDLLNAWHDEKYCDTGHYFLNKYAFSPEFIPTYPDSVYIQRLASLNSPIPLIYNPNVRNFIDLYLVEKRKSVSAMIGLAHYYFPIFEEELDKNNMPLELRCLPIIESALNTFAVSRCGATGVWQFMYQTGKLYGLNITSYVDERRDPYMATVAAIAYLKDMYNIYHDWLLVVASYNCGAANVNRAIHRAGNKTNFWEIYPYLPYETRGYVPAFIAANYVMNFYKEHNIYPTQIYYPGMTDTIYSDRNINFSAISKVLNISLDKIRIFNPQYPRDVLPKSTPEAKYTLRLPITDIIVYEKNKALVMAYQDTIDNEFNERYSMNYNQPPTKSDIQYTLLYYKVKQGDNLGFISSLFNCDIYDIKRWNNIRGFEVYTGRLLKIYLPSYEADQYKNINYLTYEQKINILQNKARMTDTNNTSVKKEEDKTNGQAQPNQNTQTNKPQASNSNTNNTNTNSSNTNSSQTDNKPAKQQQSNPNEDKYIYYTIKNGDTLWSIAQKFPLNTPSDLMQLNNISSYTIRPGQKIKVKVNN